MNMMRSIYLTIYRVVKIEKTQSKWFERDLAMTMTKWTLNMLTTCCLAYRPLDKALLLLCKWQKIRIDLSRVSSCNYYLYPLLSLSFKWFNVNFFWGFVTFFTALNFHWNFYYYDCCSLSLSLFFPTHISIRVVTIKVFAMTRTMFKRIKIQQRRLVFFPSLYLIIMMTTWCRQEKRIHGPLFVLLVGFFLSFFTYFRHKKFLFFSFLSLCFTWYEAK